MPEDPYITYLKLPPGPRPPKAHVLLGVEPDVNDPAIIEAAAQRKMDELDQYALSSDKATRDQVQRLMSEVAKARVKLVKRAEAKVKKTATQAAPPAAPVPKAAETKAPPTPKAPKRSAEPKPAPAIPKPKRVWFAWPSLSAEAWSLLGVAWLMSLTATAVGAYFIASNRPVSEPVEIAGNNPAMAPDHAEPTDEPDPASSTEETEPETTPDQETPQETAPENESEQVFDKILADLDSMTTTQIMQQVMEIEDTDNRLLTYLRLRDELSNDVYKQLIFVVLALKTFNDEPYFSHTINILNGKPWLILGSSSRNIRGHQSHREITDLTAIQGMAFGRLELRDQDAIKDFTPLSTISTGTLYIEGCDFFNDVNLLNNIEGLRDIGLDRTPISNLRPLKIESLDALSIRNCPQLTSLDGLEGLSIKSINASSNPQLKDIEALRQLRDLKEVKLYKTGIHYEEALTLKGSHPGLNLLHRPIPSSMREPAVVAEHLAEHNKLDKIQHAPDRHKAFIKLRDTYKPFSQEQADLIEREIKHLNGLDRLQFAMEGDPIEPRIMVGLVDNIAGSQNHLITDLSPLTGINTHTLAVQHLPNLRDFDFLNDVAVDTLKLTGCSQFRNLEPIRKIEGLSMLDIGKTGVIELRALKLKSLKRLSIDGCLRLTDLYGLQGMQIEELYAAGCAEIRDVSALSSVRGLQRVDLSGTAIKSATALSRQRDLKFLSLSGCKKLATLSGLHLLRGLVELHLYDTPLLDHVDTEQLEERLPDTRFVYKDSDVRADPGGAARDDKEAEREDKLADREDKEAEAKTVKNIKELTKIKSGEERLKAYYKLRDSLEPYSDEQRQLVQWAFSQSNTPDKMEECVGAYGDSFNLYYRTYRAEDRPHTVDYITDLSAFTGLKFTTLDLDRATNLRDFSPIGTMSIMRLDLSRTRLTDLKQIKGVKDLVQLDLSATGIRDLKSLEAEELGRLELEKCPRLTSLDGLEGKTIDTISASGSVNLSDFSALNEIKGLENLTLSGTRIGSLKQLEGLDELEYLNLMDCKNLSSLGTLTKLKSLKSVYLYRTNVPERDLRALQAAIPNARIAY